MNRGTVIYSLEEIDIPVRFVHQLLSSVHVVTLTGMMGVGKTTFVAALLAYCGIPDFMQSPTFQYVVRYAGPDGRQYYHFDLYRMKTQEQFIQEGLLELLLEPGSISFIEWPELVAHLLPPEVCHVAFDYVNEEKRRVRYEVTGKITL